MADHAERREDRAQRVAERDPGDGAKPGPPALGQAARDDVGDAGSWRDAQDEAREEERDELRLSEHPCLCLTWCA